MLADSLGTLAISRPNNLTEDFWRNGAGQDLLKRKEKQTTSEKQAHETNLDRKAEQKPYEAC